MVWPCTKVQPAGKSGAIHFFLADLCAATPLQRNGMQPAYFQFLLPSPSILTQLLVYTGLRSLAPSPVNSAYAFPPAHPQPTGNPSLRLLNGYVRVHRLRLIMSDHHFHHPHKQTFYGIWHQVPNGSNFEVRTRLDNTNTFFTLHNTIGRAATQVIHSLAHDYQPLPLPHTEKGVEREQ